MEDTDIGHVVAFKREIQLQVISIKVVGYTIELANQIALR